MTGKVNLNIKSARVTLNRVNGMIKERDFISANKQLRILNKKITYIQRLVRQENKIKIPEMIALSDELSIMKSPATVGFYKQVMEGYEFSGHRADVIKAILDDPLKNEHTMFYVSLNDAIEFARRLSKQTGRNFHIQHRDQFLRAGNQLLKGHNHTWAHFVGRYYWTITSISQCGCGPVDPDARCGDTTVRLVEYK